MLPGQTRGLPVSELGAGADALEKYVRPAAYCPC
jgi:hypothetical protein